MRAYIGFGNEPKLDNEARPGNETRPGNENGPDLARKLDTGNKICEYKLNCKFYAVKSVCDTDIEECYYRTALQRREARCREAEAESRRKIELNDIGVLSGLKR